MIHIHAILNMPLRVFAILVALTIISLSAAVYYGPVDEHILKPPTEIDGFPALAAIHNGQGSINISESQIEVEASSASQPRILVFASTNTFKWSFSVVPLMARGDSYPIAFSVDWMCGELHVWAHTTNGWYFNYRTDNEWHSNGTDVGSRITPGSQYDVEIEWERQQENVTLILSLANSTWHEELRLEVAIPSNTHIDYSSVYIEAWANQDAYSLARYYSSQFVSYNTDKYLQKTILGSQLLSICSVVLFTATVLVLLRRFRQYFSDVRMCLSRISDTSLSLRIERSAGKALACLRRNRVCFLLLVIFGGTRLALAATTSGHLFDIHSIRTWFYVIQRNGPIAIFPVSDILPPYLGLRPVYPYPPIIAYILFLFQKLPMITSDNSLALRLPPIVGDLLLGLVVFATFRDREGAKTGLVALFLSLLNMVNSSVWGQYDSIVALFMVSSAWLVATERIELGWFFAALAVTTKQTALVFLPGLLVLSIKKKRWLRSVFGFMIFAATFLAVWYPFMMHGFSLDFALGGSGLRLWSSGGGLDPVSPEGGGGTSIWAFNIWPLITSVLNGQPPSMGVIGTVKDTLPNQLAGMSYFQFGIVIFALIYALVLTRIRRVSNPRDVMAQFGLLMLVFYMFPTRIHERHLIFALSFLPIAYRRSKALIGSHLLLLAAYWLSLGYALLGGPWAQNLGGFSFLFDIVFSEIGLFVIILMNVSAFLLLTYVDSGELHLWRSAVTMFRNIARGKS